MFNVLILMFCLFNTISDCAYLCDHKWGSLLDKNHEAYSFSYSLGKVIRLLFHFLDNVEVILFVFLMGYNKSTSTLHPFSASPAVAIIVLKDLFSSKSKPSYG